MVDRLPLARPFRPGKLRWRLVDARIQGPDSYGLPPDSVTTDGGGWWVAELGEMPALTPDELMTLRATAVQLRGGRRIDVPFLEQRPTGGVSPIEFGDDALFDDGADWGSGLVTAVLDQTVGLRADEARIRVTSGAPLVGGDAFSLWRGPDLGSELHVMGAVQSLGDNVWAVEVAPQMRQAYPANVEVNFNDPHCAMRLVDPEGRMWPEIGRGWNPRAGARFEEAVR